LTHLNKNLEKLLFECICDLLPKHKIRLEAPPKDVIEKKRAEVLASFKKERLERQKDFNKRGIRTTKKNRTAAAKWIWSVLVNELKLMHCDFDWIFGFSLH